jgi:hypothetical protein
MEERLTQDLFMNLNPSQRQSFYEAGDDAPDLLTASENQCKSS